MLRWVGLALAVAVGLGGCSGREGSEPRADPATSPSQHRPSATAEPLPVWPPGIFDDVEAPIGTATFRATGRWVGEVGGVSVALYAGADGQHPRTGAVLLMRADHARPSGFWRLPDTGALHVRSARGRSIELVDAAGRSHVFDVAAGEWVRGGPPTGVRGADMPCDPGFGFPEPSATCPDDVAATGWLTRRPNGRLYLEPFTTYVNDAEGRAFAEANDLEYPFSNDYYDASVGRPQSFALDASTICTGAIHVGYGGPLEDHVVDCERLGEALNRTDRVSVAVWSSDGHAVQVSELYRP